MKQEEYPLQSGCSQECVLSLRTSPHLWIRQVRHFYFFLFLLSKKARNATIKLPKEQAQNTYNYRNNLKSRHYNAPPFLCNPVFWYKFGRLPPCHGHSNACFHAYLEYHISHVYSIVNRILVRFIFMVLNTQKPPKAPNSRRSPIPNLS